MLKLYILDMDCQGTITVIAKDKQEAVKHVAAQKLPTFCGAFAWEAFEDRAQEFPIHDGFILQTHGDDPWGRK